MQAAVNHWQGLFNVGADEGASWQPEVAAKDAFLKQMEQDPKCHLSPEHAEKLRPENMFSVQSICKAMDAIKKGTMPGGSGVTVDLICHKQWRQEMSAHVR